MDKEAAMHYFRHAVERARTVIGHSRPVTELDYRQKKRSSSGGFSPSTGDHDVQTIVLLSVIAILSMLDFMLFCPDLGAVIAQYNQF